MAIINRYLHNRRLSLPFAGLIATLCALALLSRAQQPVLTIAPLGGNQFNLVITNGVTTTNYTLFWTPVLEHPNYPWIALLAGEVGQTNFLVDGGSWPFGFFRAMTGSDADADGVPAWQDANDHDPNVGILTITIDSPTHGFNFN